MRNRPGKLTEEEEERKKKKVWSSFWTAIVHLYVALLCLTTITGKQKINRDERYCLPLSLSLYLVPSLSLILCLSTNISSVEGPTMMWKTSSAQQRLKPRDGLGDQEEGYFFPVDERQSTNIVVIPWTIWTISRCDSACCRCSGADCDVYVCLHCMSVSILSVSFSSSYI